MSKSYLDFTANIFGVGSEKNAERCISALKTSGFEEVCRENGINKYHEDTLIVTVAIALPQNEAKRLFSETLKRIKAEIRAEEEAERALKRAEEERLAAVRAAEEAEYARKCAIKREEFLGKIAIMPLKKSPIGDYRAIMVAVYTEYNGAEWPTGGILLDRWDEVQLVYNEKDMFDEGEYIAEWDLNEDDPLIIRPHIRCGQPWINNEILFIEASQSLIGPYELLAEANIIIK